MAMSVQLVRTVQSEVDVPRTGVWDAATVNAVKTWQASRGLQATGELDGATFKAMFPYGYPPNVSGLGGKKTLFVGLGLAAVALFLWKR